MNTIPEFNNLAELQSYLEKEINDSLQNEVAQITKEAISAEVNASVFSVYPEPKVYDRRNNEGIDDINQMESELISNGMLAVSDNAKANPNIYIDNALQTSGNANEDLTPIIVSGEGYDFLYDYSYNQPRDFIEATRDTLSKTHLHTETLKQGLIKRGLKVE